MLKIGCRQINRQINRWRLINLNQCKNKAAHTLRHTNATNMNLDSVDLRRVQEYPGHHSPETTTIYTRITDKMKSEVRSPLDNLTP